MGLGALMAWRACVFVLLCIAAAPPVGAQVARSVQVHVTGNGQPLGNAVVSLHSTTTPPQAGRRGATSEMDQRDMQFEPHVLAVRAGTSVRFPNSDNIRHQVYSFSPAKTFELPLYSGQPGSPVRFDSPGVVELGCNIHDWMLGYIVIVDTPHFAITGKDGMVTIQAPAGKYRLQVWHEWQRSGPAQPAVRSIVVGAGGTRERIDIDVQPAPPPRQPVDERLRKLQERFRNVKRGA